MKKKRLTKKRKIQLGVDALLAYIASQRTISTTGYFNN